MWGSFPNRKERWWRSTIRCVKEGYEVFKPKRLDAHVSCVWEKERLSLEGEKKRKIEADPSSKWLAQRIISCCRRLTGSWHGAIWHRTPLQSPPEERGLRVRWVLCICGRWGHWRFHTLSAQWSLPVVRMKASVKVLLCSVAALITRAPCSCEWVCEVWVSVWGVWRVWRVMCVCV